jgi:hypothetical protein
MEKTYICLFDLRPYDKLVAPALRQYVRDYDPRGVVALLRSVREMLPDLKLETSLAPIAERGRLRTLGGFSDTRCRL